ncbi:MAG: hypothetical protein CMD73_00510 [Gammaproteobacteria bacterium]|jgi:antitoxin CptB|nr:hypothetical protein [Gammaproteobacteria bacterium]|tara:strand:+ start:387 stop:617 length:231 start_codon:yes stop_codon:yes gene_type:complete
MEISRVIWKCRKGIREIDILLSRYTEKIYPTLDKKQQDIYVEFIDLDTYEILDMLVNNKSCDKKYQKIVEALKSFN